MTATTILAQGDLGSWDAVTLTLEGDKEWDKTVFTKICTTTPYDATSCGTKWSSSMAKAMWTYTDGYSLKLTSKNY